MLATAPKYYRDQQDLTALAVRQVRRVSSVDKALPLLAIYQSNAALLALEHGTVALREQGIPDDGAQVVPVAFTVTPGAPSVLDDADTQFRFDRIVASLVADAGRSAMGAFAASRRDQQVGSVRQLTSPSCQRCAILAGRWYRWSEGFQRHPRCFPAGVVASGPRLEAASRRWYEGEVVVLTTASGQELPLTGNHPVLTRRGWVPANLVREGDEVVRSARPQGATALVVPNHDEVPTRVEDVWRAFSMSGLDSVESAAEDFHGDGQRGKVDVVRANGALDLRIQATIRQEFAQQHLAVTAGPPLSFDSEGAAVPLDLADAAHSRGAVRTGGLSLTLLIVQASVAGLSGITHVPSFHSGFAQHAADSASRDRVFAGQGEFAGAALIGGNDAVGGDVDPRTRWDAPTLSDPLHQSAGYAAVGLDLLDRLAGQVELDRVVLSRSVQFRGHVYSLSSSEGWHSANSLIVSNCDCVMIPGTRSAGTYNPHEAYERGEITDLSKAQRQAIDNGADINQVVNARRGMQTVNFAGRRLQITTEGTTSRGLAFDSLARRGGSARVDAGFSTRITANGPQSRRVTQTAARAPRLSPEAIYNVSDGSRETAIRLLRANGYIV